MKAAFIVKSLSCIALCLVADTKIKHIVREDSHLIDLRFIVRRVFIIYAGWLWVSQQSGLSIINRTGCWFHLQSLYKFKYPWRVNFRLLLVVGEISGKNLWVKIKTLKTLSDTLTFNVHFPVTCQSTGHTGSLKLSIICSKSGNCKIQPFLFEIIFTEKVKMMSCCWCWEKEECITSSSVKKPPCQFLIILHCEVV